MVGVRTHLLISGLVQGVFFRAKTRYQARALGLTGWVRNRWDGKVEAIFEGEKTKVDQIVNWCRRGPAGAVVKNVEVSREDYSGEFDSFSIKS
ncbi:MAG: acylphosphatase [Candidatus Omnitrophota bacterium]|nr:acylphosphatase [Candidatus Omnitrophota bacterium]